jgi:hypothetical protein
MVKSDDQVATVTGESLFVNDQFVALGHCTHCINSKLET